MLCYLYLITIEKNFSRKNTTSELCTFCLGFCRGGGNFFSIWLQSGYLITGTQYLRRKVTLENPWASHRVGENRLAPPIFLVELKQTLLLWASNEIADLCSGVITKYIFQETPRVGRTHYEEPSEPRPADSPPLLVLEHKPAEWAVTSPTGCVIFLSLLQSWMGSWGGSSEVAFVWSKGTGNVPYYHPLSGQLILMGFHKLL